LVRELRRTAAGLAVIDLTLPPTADSNPYRPLRAARDLAPGTTSPHHTQTLSNDAMSLKRKRSGRLVCRILRLSSRRRRLAIWLSHVVATRLPYTTGDLSQIGPGCSNTNHPTDPPPRPCDVRPHRSTGSDVQQ
jgi:hypothetical protein